MKTLRQKLHEKLTLRKIQWITLSIVLAINVFIFIQILTYAEADVETLTAITFFTAIAASVIGFPTEKQQIPVILAIVGNMILVTGATYSLIAATIGIALVLCGLVYPFHRVSYILISYLRIFVTMHKPKVVSIIPRPLLGVLGKIADKTTVFLRHMFLIVEALHHKGNRLIKTTSNSIGLIFREIYHERTPILLIVILFTPIITISHLQMVSSEHIINGNFKQEITNWEVHTYNCAESIRFQTGYSRPEEPTLLIAVGGERGLKHGYVKVGQPLDLKMIHGDWVVSGYMKAVDVRDDCDALALSVVMVLEDTLGKTRYLKYTLFEKGSTPSTSTSGVIEVGRGRDQDIGFKRDLIEDVKRVWAVGSTVEWRITAIELRVEFWNTWGEVVHVGAIFDDISLRSVIDIQWLFDMVGYISIVALILAVASVGVVNIWKASLKRC